MNRIKSLDGIRAISILMVLLGHAKNTMPPYMLNNKVFLYFANSDTGVRIFFVISGYLITKLLLAEHEKYGKISLKGFYLRRIFRIFPVFYLYILVVLSLKIFFIPNIFDHYQLAIAASLYIWNYMHLFLPLPSWGHDHGLDVFGHFWTLAMEEQFYLLWPIILIRSGKDKAVKLVTAVIILMPFLRLATYYLMPDSRGQIGLMLHTGGDSIFLGCLGALLEQNTSFRDKWFKYLNNNFLIAGVAIFLFVISRYLSLNLKGSYTLLIGMSLNNVCVLILLYWSIYVPSKVANVLNSKFLIQIGILSYSIYIWQQLFLASKLDFWICKFPQNLLAVFVAGFFSYYVIEKPILNLRKKLKTAA